MQVGSKHQEFEKICTKLSLIPNKGDKVSFSDDEKVDPAKLLPVKDCNAPLEFWRYEGSLTTPPLLESVIWTVFKKPIQVSDEQVTLILVLERVRQWQSFARKLSKDDKDLRNISLNL